VPAPDKLTPNKTDKKKNMPADYVGVFLASLPKEELLRIVAENKAVETAKEHYEKNNMADKPAEFYYASDTLSDELKRDLNSFFSNEKNNK